MCGGRRLEGIDLSNPPYTNSSTLRRRSDPTLNPVVMAGAPVSIDNLGYLNVEGTPSRGSFVEGIVDASVRPSLVFCSFWLSTRCIWMLCSDCGGIADTHFRPWCGMMARLHHDRACASTVYVTEESALCPCVQGDFITTIPRPRSVRDSILDDEYVTAAKVGEMLNDRTSNSMLGNTVFAPSATGSISSSSLRRETHF